MEVEDYEKVIMLSLLFIKALVLVLNCRKNIYAIFFF